MNPETGPTNTTGIAPKFGMCPVSMFTNLSNVPPTSPSGYEPDNEFDDDSDDDSGDSEDYDDYYGYDCGTDEESDTGSSYSEAGFNTVSGYHTEDSLNPPCFLHSIPIQEFYTAKTDPYPESAIVKEIKARRQRWKGELTEDAWRLLTNLNRDIHADEIIEVVGSDPNDIIPREAWEVELVWRERGHRRDAYRQSIRTVAAPPDSPQDTVTDSSQDTVIDSSLDTVTNPSQDELAASPDPLRNTATNSSRDEVAAPMDSEDTNTDPFGEDDTIHDIPANHFYKDETSAYPDEILDRELQWRRRSWQGVLPEETWAELTDPAIDITTDDFLNKVGEYERHDIQIDAWEVEQAWRERDIRISRREASKAKIGDGR